MLSKGIHAALQTLLIALLLYMSLSPFLPPSSVPDTAPQDVFSSGRAMHHLEQISRQPHPTGSKELQRVREYIIAQLKALGIEPEIQQSKATVNGQALDVYNVIGEIKGTHSTKDVLLSAHYDTVPESNGASDDGSGVVTLLETARLIKSGPPLANNIILLFTDGEEIDLLGAQAFAKQMASLADIGIVINFEARGNGGPSVLFETGTDRNYSLMRDFAKTAPYPIAYSFVFNLYKYMPNSTDMNVFKASGIQGLNFGFTFGLDAYHTDSDTIENIHEGSLQHHGSHAASMAQYLGNADLNAVIEGEKATYFNIAGHRIVVYPQQWDLYLMIGAVILFYWTMYSGVKRGKIQLAQTLKSSYSYLFSAFIVMVMIAALGWVLRIVFAYHKQQFNDPEASIYLGIGMLLLSVALLARKYATLALAGRTSLLNLYFGIAAVHLSLAILTFFIFPGGTYMFLWSVIGMLTGLTIVFRLQNAKPPMIQSILLLCGVPGLLVAIPFVAILFMLLPFTLWFAFFLACLFPLGLLLPYFSLWRNIHGRSVPLFSSAAGLLFLFIGLLRLM
ncbi:M20/M25/M40 family metallo-hydrolase [Paenibacillus oenotherae]|uniref:M20/M25/M40 family metallo-hydrolase n=1 Tax=Paenibacillus oenotherae TaxID=1435645 RepID=A0ABS7D4E1_9BACL|nr:M20/M25/M40 family metallo-hydrolase [Paenibacillus oenotherae]MBW7474721.1 M20/M25/M40 family metallo-hydrolase [Paenibacillus oenotherae]